MDEYRDIYRKPDFQRQTSAWTPEDCVELLESVIMNQVVPSIIMWRSPDNGLRYILDGGHRISVIIAWFHDDWGESQADGFEDPQKNESVRKAANEVRILVKSRIGHISDYKFASDEIRRISHEGGAPRQALESVQAGKAFQRGMFFQNVRSDDVVFPILWVDGDYRTAEQSFLKINRSGRQITDWEKKLIENRESSFARLVMSLSDIRSAPHYWPLHTDSDDRNDLIAHGAQHILGQVEYLNRILFQPEYKRNVTTLAQPLMVAPNDKKPYFLAEILTIANGYKGQPAETQRLLQIDANAEPSEIVQNGVLHVDRTIEMFDHIIGDIKSSDPANKSLELVPLLYFYKSDGFYIRSQLYGFLYWLIAGDDDQIRLRKIIFSAYRGAFEQIFNAEKDHAVQTLTRGIGSGTDITVQTSFYINTLLQLIVKHKGVVDSDVFLNEYSETVGKMTKNSRQLFSIQAVKSRLFTPKQKSATFIDTQLKSLYVCEICGGKLDPQRKNQRDHRKARRHDGQTSIDNQRIVHPFCNNQRESIFEIQKGAEIQLPRFDFELDPDAPKQLSLFDDPAFM
jgi:hypothetical protein